MANAEPITIAIIDTGIDVNRPTISSHLWINEGEIPNNGIDDDYNGFVDDIVGWNFIGAKDGNAKFEIKENSISLFDQQDDKQIRYDNKEIVREFNSLYEKQNRNLDDSQRLAYLQSLINSKLERAHILLTQYQRDKRAFEFSAERLGLEPKSLKDVLSLGEKPTQGSESILAYDYLYDSIMFGIDYEFITKEIDLFQVQIDYHYNINLSQRSRIVSDNPEKFIEEGYGNNDVAGPTYEHGTKVALQLIQTLRERSTSIEIMPLRAIPQGAERDKDVANAIYYAVENGAQIINMSFGKYFSEFHADVWKAMKYAQRHGVLLVLAAGNDNLNLDEKKSFPNPSYQEERLGNVLVVGASDQNGNKTNFSNYGTNSVDLFTRGEVIATSGLPNENLRGTSFAAPIVAGCVAFLSSERENLAPHEIVSILKDSALFSSQNIPNLNLDQVLNSL